MEKYNEWFISVEKNRAVPCALHWGPAKSILPLQFFKHLNTIEILLLCVSRLKLAF